MSSMRGWKRPSSGLITRLLNDSLSGVATVVLKLLNIVQPQLAVFGKKDYQQCRVLSDMVRQFNLPVEMILAETVRADDGLALSQEGKYPTWAKGSDLRRFRRGGDVCSADRQVPRRRSDCRVQHAEFGDGALDRCRPRH